MLDNIRFECTSCGHCCQFPADVQRYIFVSQTEAKRIQAATGLPWSDVTMLDGKGRLSLRTVAYGEGMACRFLVEGRCSVYEARPRQCRTFPFWPDHLRSREAWEAVPCEGIGRGDVIPVGEVTRRLKAATL
jgi:Fe-S-cluster containining protein